MDFVKLNFIVHKFFINSKVLNISQKNSGLINKTYIVEHLYNGIKSKFVLQSLSNIFQCHEIVNTNHKLITDHIIKKINNSSLKFDYYKWKVPSLIKCETNNLFWFHFESGYWRAMLYIEDAVSLEKLIDKKMAYQAGVGLSKFHFLCSDFDCKKLGNSIKNFHDTRYYLQKYNMTLDQYNSNKLDYQVSKRVDNLIKILSNHIILIDSILRSFSTKITDKNIIHGDPKLSNFLFDIKNYSVVSLIDLDTVNSGNLLSDLADCIRSVCNLAGENPLHKDDVYFDIDSCMYFLQGYLSINKNKNYSFRYLPEFIYLIIFELTIRFLTDFLQSNKYFKIKYETHNLYRAEVQYRLLTSFLIQMPTFSKELDDIGISSSSNFYSDVQKLV